MSRLVLAIATVLVIAGIAANGDGQTTPNAAQLATSIGDQPDLHALARDLTAEAKRLQDDTASRLTELSKLERELQDNQENTVAARQNVDALVKLLSEARDRLSPDGKFRKALTAEEDAARNLARGAAADPDQEIRAMADKFKQAASDIGSMASEAEEARTRLTAQVDRLVQLRGRLVYATALAEVDRFVANARAYLDNLNAIADGAQNLANKLDNFGHGVPTQ